MSSIILPHRRKAFQPAGGPTPIIRFLNDEGSGTTAEDDISAETLTLGANTTWFTTGYTALDFDNTTTAGMVSTDGQFTAMDDLTSAVTVFARVSIDASFGFQNRIAFEYGGQASDRCLTLGFRKFRHTGSLNLQAQWLVDAGGTAVNYQPQTSDPGIAVDEEFTIIGIYDDPTMEVFVNNVSIGSQSHSAGGNVTAPTNKFLVEGARISTTTPTLQNQFNGTIRDLQIFDFALDSSERASL